MSRLPKGTTTFLFTDIEGSTRLWEAEPVEMKVAMTRHEALVAQVIPSLGGHVVHSRGEGDSVFAVFSRAADAVTAACELQIAFTVEAWPTETPVRARMALHTGEAFHRSDDYFGTAVNRCARLRAIAHGGQVLLSRTTVDLVREELPKSLDLKDLGIHRLRDLTLPEQVFQLLHDSLPSAFPPLRSLNAYAHNLPLQLSSFVGRKKEIAEVETLLRETSLLTLTGSGGCGKSRLAMQVAAELSDDFREGVWVVELAPLSDPSLVVQTVGSALKVREQPGQPIQQTLIDYLRDSKTLLVIDNCEHLLDACAQLATGIRRACAEVRILATSRERLGVDGEVVYRVPSLSLPKDSASPDRLMNYEAVRLFAERSRSCLPSFELTDANASAVGEVCRQLDGIPLAIELAAARVRVLTVEQIASRLRDRFHLLTTGSRVALPRHQTLESLVSWSVEMLSEDERLLLGRLSVFSGGWTFEAAESVCSFNGIEAREVLDLLSAIVDKSLVIYDERADRSRYRLLETVRDYSRKFLLPEQDLEMLRDRHLRYFVDLAERIEARTGAATEQAWWLDRLESDQDNVRAALEWSRRGEETAELALRLAASSFWYWYLHGYLTEGSARLEESLQRAKDAPPGIRAKAMCGAGYIAYFLGERERARTLVNQGIVILREVGDRWYLAVALNLLGNISLYDGDFVTAKSAAVEGLGLAREQGNQLFVAFGVFLLGLQSYLEGDLKHAEDLVGESVALWRRTGSQQLVANALVRLGDVQQRAGRPNDAAASYCESLDHARQIGSMITIARSLQGLAGVCAATAQLEKAARLLGARSALVERMGISLPAFESQIYELCASAVRERMGISKFEAARVEGSRMSREEAVDYALGEHFGEMSLDLAVTSA